MLIFRPKGRLKTIKHIAHVKQLDKNQWAEPHWLQHHLNATAQKAEIFSNKFASGEWGRAAGFAHDIGKGRLVWQDYLQNKSGYRYDEEAHLENKPGKIPHAIHGAQMVEMLFGKGVGRFLAYIIAGHHAGLPDWSSAEGAGMSALNYQINAPINLDEIEPEYTERLKQLKPVSPPWKFDNGLDLSLWLRMLYSCLVDADFLDTEAYMDQQQSAARGTFMTLPDMQENLNYYIDKLEKEAPGSKINKIRKMVRTKCLEKAAQGPGIFSMAVPTGGGKTLSSLSFAFAHAIKNDLDRVIYVIPYTSIIEQNAGVFRKALGSDQVVEHHSNLSEADDTPKARLASENWDAPLIVTTAVQFFESLFAAKSSRCRKLHNIVNSIIILDEAQLLPVEYLDPILQTMQLLANNYKVSFVLSTATQPAFKECQVQGHSFSGFMKVEDIMGESIDELYHKLKRVKVTLPTDMNTTTCWKEIASSLVKHDQVLCIVSDRKSCRELHSLMPEQTYHLSSLMCGQHRSIVIDQIKTNLKENKTVRVISTQLVEAGVDIDFPVVYRALAGLDSLAQAAGRCNREGKLTYGKLKVFNAPRRPPAGILRKAADITKNLLAEKPQDILDHNLFEKYFSELYWAANSLDQKDINTLLTPEQLECGLYFRTAAARFRIIDDSAQKSIIVPYEEGERLINILKSNGPERWLMRKLQRYTVNIFNHEFDALVKEGAIEEVQPNIYVLAAESFYSKTLGLLVFQNNYEPEDFII